MISYFSLATKPDELVSQFSIVGSHSRPVPVPSGQFSVNGSHTVSVSPLFASLSEPSQSKINGSQTSALVSLSGSSDGSEQIA